MLRRNMRECMRLFTHEYHSGTCVVYAGVSVGHSIHAYVPPRRQPSRPAAVHLPSYSRRHRDPCREDIRIKMIVALSIDLHGISGAAQACMQFMESDDTDWTI